MRRAFFEAMFQAVDEARWDDLERFYHPACVYDRPGFERLEGIASVTRFYRHERPILFGVHRLEDVLESGLTACVIGSFEGRLKDGGPIRLTFADRYGFEEDRIARRQTFFYTPLA